MGHDGRHRGEFETSRSETAFAAAMPIHLEGNLREVVFSLPSTILVASDTDALSFLLVAAQD
jgi:hypothetical protein